MGIAGDACAELRRWPAELRRGWVNDPGYTALWGIIMVLTFCFLGALSAWLIQQLSPLDDAVWITVVLAVFCTAAMPVVLAVESVVPDSRTRTVVTAILVVCWFVLEGFIFIYDKVSTVAFAFSHDWAWLMIPMLLITALNFVTKSSWVFLLQILWLLVAIVAVLVAVL